jgi:hypothetical protein
MATICFWFAAEAEQEKVGEGAPGRRSRATTSVAFLVEGGPGGAAHGLGEAHR